MKLRWSFFMFAIVSMQLFAHENNHKTTTEFSKKISFKNIMISLHSYQSIGEALESEQGINWNQEDEKAEAITDAFAASELQLHFKLLGKRVNILPYQSKSIGKTIVVIDEAIFKKNHPNLASRIAFEGLGDQGFAIVVEKKALFIVANTRIGRLYGVYEFLKEMGFSWYNPKEITIPKNFANSLKAFEITKTPSIELRGFWTFAKENISEKYLVWLARNRFNIVGNAEQNTVKKLGFKIWAGTHSLIQEEFSKDGLFEQHPDWFTMHKGKRFPVAATGQYVNPSFSNKEAANYFANQLIKRLQSGDLKHVDILNLWPADKKNIRIDENENSKAVGNFSDTLLYFYTIIAEKLNQAYEKKELTRKVTLAGISYHYTMQEPTNKAIVKSLEAKNYLHIIYPSTRDWSYSIGIGTERSDENMKLTTAIDNWNKSADFQYGLVDYNLKSNYAGIAITNHTQIATDFDYYFQKNIALYGYMHPVKENPGPMELTNTLVSALSWKQTNETSSFISKINTKRYFKDKYGVWAEQWLDIYDKMMRSVSNAKQLFETGSLSSVVFQKVYWLKPPFSSVEVAKLIPKYLEGGLQHLPDSYTNSMENMKTANFIGLNQSINIQSDLEETWNTLIEGVNDKVILQRMKNDIAWFRTTKSKYVTLKLCSDLASQNLELEHKNQIIMSILKEVEFLNESKTLSDFISPVNSKGFITVIKKFVAQF